MKLLTVMKKAINGLSSLMGYAVLSVPVWAFIGLVASSREVKEETGIDIEQGIKDGIKYLFED